MAVRMTHKKPKNTEPKLRFSVTHALTSLYVIMLFTVFPLFQSQFFTRTRRDKFTLFVVFTLLAGISVGAVALVNYLSRNNEYNKKLNTYRDPLKISITDIGVLAFVIVSVISTAISRFSETCFIAYTTEEVSLIGNNGTTVKSTVNSGRNMGLLMILMMFLCYLVILAPYKLIIVSFDFFLNSNDSPTLSTPYFLVIVILHFFLFV